ncbi:hypothetical protein [Paenibacillus lignilyticus]|uniref:Uncharacterized protein n=1 Tax=Paenibacillus lignilyticus TaxID=1172615 RepID=A0ABS5CJR1_9BACL|nr:hypothetical protein [Paenibacillus lignilyticus]MBP3966039.1 hypothetical protein [Paenibacillus lignilyticus]
MQNRQHSSEDRQMILKATSYMLVELLKLIDSVPYILACWSSLPELRFTRRSIG